MRARSVTARVTIETNSSIADGSTFCFAPDPLTADQRSIVFSRMRFFGGNSLAGLAIEGRIASEKTYAPDIAKQHNARLRQIATNLVILLGRDGLDHRVSCPAA